MSDFEILPDSAVVRTRARNTANDSLIEALASTLKAHPGQWVVIPSNKLVKLAPASAAYRLRNLLASEGSVGTRKLPDSRIAVKFLP